MVSPTSTAELSPSPSSVTSPSSGSLAPSPSTGSAAGKKKAKKPKKKKAASEGGEGKEQLLAGDEVTDSAAVTPLSHSPTQNLSPYGAPSTSDDSHDPSPSSHFSGPRMPPGADHAQKLQEHFPMRQTAQGGFVILPPDQAPPPQSANDLSPVTHQPSPRRVYPPKQQRQSAGPVPPHLQHPVPNNLPYRGTPPRRGLPFPPQSPQRHSPSYRGRALNQQPRHPQPGYGYYPNAPFQPYVDAQGHPMDSQSMVDDEGGASPLQLGMGMPSYPHMQMGGGLVQMPYQQMGMMPGMMGQPIVGSASNPLMSSGSSALSPMQLLQQQAGQQPGPGQPGPAAPPSRREDIRKQMSVVAHPSCAQSRLR